MLDFAFLLWLLSALATPSHPERSEGPGRAAHDARASLATRAPDPSTHARDDISFTRDVRPILEKRCTPCHFAGGKMHAKLPFDKPETIHHLGDRLFSRIKKDDEQAVIRAFLAQR